MSKNKNDKLNKNNHIYILVKGIQARMILITIIHKKKKLAWGTHSFINKLSEFTKFCKFNFVFYAH